MSDDDSSDETIDFQPVPSGSSLARKRGGSVTGAGHHVHFSQDDDGFNLGTGVHHQRRPSYQESAASIGESLVFEEASDPESVASGNHLSVPKRSAHPSPTAHKVRVVTPQEASASRGVLSVGSTTMQTDCSESIFFEEEKNSSTPPQKSMAVSSTTLGESIDFEEATPSQTNLTPQQNRPSMAISSTTLGESLVFEEASLTPATTPPMKPSSASPLSQDSTVQFRAGSDARGASPIPHGFQRSRSSSTSSSTSSSESIAFINASRTIDSDTHSPPHPPPSASASGQTRDSSEKPRSPVQAKEAALSASSSSPSRAAGAEKPQRQRETVKRTASEGSRRTQSGGRKPPPSGTGSDGGWHPRADSQNGPWQAWLRNPSDTQSDRRSHPRWQAGATLKRDATRLRGPYSGCTFGAPEDPRSRDAVVHNRDNTQYAKMREIDKLRQSSQPLTCPRCNGPYHLLRDCPKLKLEEGFDPSGGIQNRRVITGYFGPPPPVERKKYEFKGARPRYMDPTDRSATPPTRCRTPPKGEGRDDDRPPFRVRGTRPGGEAFGNPPSSANSSPRKRDSMEMMRKLREENRRLQKAVEEMRAKMGQLENMNYAARLERDREWAQETEPLSGQASPRRSFSPVDIPRVPPKSARAATNNEVPRTRRRANSAPKRRPSHNMNPTRGSRTPMRTRASAPSPVDWPQSRAAQWDGGRQHDEYYPPYQRPSDDMERYRPGSRSSSPGHNELRGSYTTLRPSPRNIEIASYSPERVHIRSRIRRVQPSSRSSSAGSNGIPACPAVEQAVAVAVGPTLDARIQHLEMMQRDVRQALMRPSQTSTPASAPVSHLTHNGSDDYLRRFDHLDHRMPARDLPAAIPQTVADLPTRRGRPSERISFPSSAPQRVHRSNSAKRTSSRQRDLQVLMRNEKRRWT